MSTICKTLTVALVVVVGYTTPAAAKKEFGNHLAKIGQRAFGLSADDATPKRVITEMEQFCSTTKTPEMCEYFLADCALTVESNGFKVIESWKLDDTIHAMKESPLKHRLKAKLIQACARNETAQWVEKKRIEDTVTPWVNAIFPAVEAAELLPPRRNGLFGIIPHCFQHWSTDLLLILIGIYIAFRVTLDVLTRIRKFQATKPKSGEGTTPDPS